MLKVFCKKGTFLKNKVKTVFFFNEKVNYLKNCHKKTPRTSTMKKRQKNMSKSIFLK